MCMYIFVFATNFPLLQNEQYITQHIFDNLTLQVTQNAILIDDS